MISSVYEQSPSPEIPYYDPEIFYISSYDDCPDTLTWSYTLHTCVIECIYPLYSDGELRALEILDYVLFTLSFLLCYFYCFTALLRPVMLKYPNSNVFHMHFSLMLASSCIFFPMFLGQRYVFCDDNISFGTRRNWACLVSGMYDET